MENASVETIVLLPHNGTHWKYIINDGSVRTIRKYKLVDFLSEYVKDRQKRSFLVERVTQLTPFIVFVKDEIIEDLNVTGEKLSVSIPVSERVLNRIKSEEFVVKEKRPNDDLLESKIDKFLKFF